MTVNRTIMYKFVLILAVMIALCRVGFSSKLQKQKRAFTGPMVEARLADELIVSSSTCVGCTKKITVEDEGKKYSVPEYSITPEEFTALRIEYIKNQILKKLRLKEKPQVTMPQLPKPVREIDSILGGINDEDMHDGYSEDFYGKTTQAIIFPYEDEARCIRKIRHPSACVPFQMPTDLHASDVSTAELWFFKEKDALDSHNQTFVISEVAHWDTNKSFQKTNPIAIQETHLEEGWLKIDVAYVIKNWLEYQDSPTHAINIACKTCGMPNDKSPISFQQTLKPFLVIDTYSQQRRQVRKRPKRHTNCSPGSLDCCREKLYVSFADIGWDDWIIAPKGYNAYFCKGSCSTAASVTLSANEHTSILRKVMTRDRLPKLELTPCCAATQFQPLQLMFIGNNKTITNKRLSNMIVDSCGCM